MPTDPAVDFESYVRAVDDGVQALARDIETPALDATGRFTHRTQDARLAAFLKAVRVASALNAALHLLRAGYVQEIGALFRVLDEACQDIGFLLIPNATDTLAGDQQRLLATFYREEIPDPNNPTVSQRGPDQVRRSRVHRAIVGQLPTDNATAEREAAFQATHRVMSGFVHGSYRNIMDLYGGDPPRYHTRGMLGAPRVAATERAFTNYVYRALLEVERLARVMGRRDVVRTALEQSLHLALETGCLSPEGIERATRRPQSL
jgi:hypothetical protein